MARFVVRCMTSGGEVVEQVVDAEDARTAERLAAARGLVPIDARRAGLRWQLPKRADVDLLMQELLALLRAGLSLTEALDALAEREQQAADGSIVQTLRRRLREGARLSAALSEQATHFPALLVAGVAASEETGALPDALARYLRYRAQADRLRQTLVSAAIYPALLLLVGLGVALFLLAYLVPRFSHIYAGLDAELPLGSRLLMQWGQLVADYPWHVALGAMALVAIGTAVLRQPAVSSALGAHLRQTRGIGSRLRVMHLARFYRALSLLVEGGIPLVKAMDRAGGLLAPALRPGLDGATRAVRQGESFTQALTSHGLSTPVADRMLRVGERNGELGAMLERVADFHEAEVARWLERFARLFEPLLMLVIGGIIGGIVVLLYLPIFELAGSLQ